MPLPTIEPYSLPGEPDLPPNRVSWTPDPDRAVLLIHDMQNYFLDAYRRDAAPIPELLGNIAALRAAAHRSGVPVVYTAQPGSQSPQQRGLLQDFWGDGIGGGTQPEITAELAPGPEDRTLTKWRYSAFAHTDLATLLHEQDRDQLLICGIYAHIGVLMTACDAFMRDLRPFVAADAIADFSAADHAMALSYAARRCAAVTTTARLDDALPARTDP